MSAPTKLMLMSCAEWGGGWRTDVIFGRICETVTIIRKTCGYTFPLPMPVMLQEVKTTMTSDAKTFWTGKPCKRQEPWYVTYANTNGADEGEEHFLQLARDEGEVANGNEEVFDCAANANVPINEHGELVLVNARGEKATIALLGREPVIVK